jgi:hypothetical protein
MKYCYVFLSMYFWKIIDAFTPYLTKYKIYTQNKCYTMFRTISGLLPKLPYSFSISKFMPNVQVTSIQNECNIETKKCTKELIIPGYKEHCPKEEAEKRHYNKYF